jgi:osmoprotectant transport system ATP-binding protein
MKDVPAVEFRNVSKVFAGSTKAVDGLTLQIPAGRIVALLGPSGCGKTTTLRLINRLEEATSGLVLVRGKEVLQERPEILRRSIGYVIQEGGLFPHVNVSTNVGLAPRLLGWDRQRVRTRVGEVLELVGLPQSQFGRRMPAELSGGQRQRVGVARALAADPDLLLMDEPFGALDPGTRESLQDEFLRLYARLKKTVVLVTHDIAEAGRLADEIVVLDKGRLAQRGTLRDLLIHPAHEGVRAFLGRRCQELAMGILRVDQVIQDLPEVGPFEPTLRLPPECPLGKALVALANATDAGTVTIAGPPERTVSAKDLKARILADLKRAGGEN